MLFRSLLGNGLALLSALGDGVRTDLNQALLPILADGASTLDATHIVSAQMRAGDGILRYRRKGEVSPYGSVVFFDPVAMSLLGSRLFPTPGTQPYGWPLKAGDPPFEATPSAPTAPPSASMSGSPSPSATATATASSPTRPYPTLATCNANVPAPVYTQEPDPTDLPLPSESLPPVPNASPDSTATPSEIPSPTATP